MRVVLADKHPEVRSALYLLLEEKAGVNVVGEVSTSQDLLRQLNQLRPDLVLLEWELPDAEPGELIKGLRMLYPDLEVIALSGNPRSREDSLKSGARDFVCKSEPPEHLMLAVNGLEI